MTRQELDQNKKILTQELRAIGRNGMEEFIQDIDAGGYFEARCSGHDRESGGTVNHCLWTLRIARQIVEDLGHNPVAEGLRDSITVVCLLHDLCDMRNYQKVKNPDRRHGAYSRRIMSFYAPLFSNEELTAVNSHMHDSLMQGGPNSDLKSNDPGTLLHAILRKADHKSIEYANGIPFTARPSVPIDPRCNHSPCSLLLDRVEHRLWLDDVGMSAFKLADGSTVRSDDMAHVPGTVCLYVWIRSAPLEADLTLVKDDNDHLAILSTSYLSGFGMPTVSKSDRACFGYRDVAVYISVYPDYRSSYVIAQRLDGKWGARAYKVSLKQKPLVRIFSQADFIYDTEREAIAAIRHGRKHFRRQVDNPLFYRRYCYSELSAVSG